MACGPDGWVEVTVTGPQPESLDLSRIGDGASVRVAARPAHRQRSLRLAGAGRGHKVVLDGTLDLEVTSGSLGVVAVDAEAGANVKMALSGDVRQLVVATGAVDLRDATIEEVRLAGGHVTGELSRIATYTVDGDVEALPTRIAVLRIARAGATVQLPRNVSVERLHLAGSDHGALTIRGGNTGASAKTLEIGRVTGDGQVQLSNARLVVQSSEGRLNVEGSGAVQIPAGCTVADLTLGPDVRLDARRGAAAIRFGGHLRAGDCQYATVEAIPGSTSDFVGIAARPGKSPGPSQLTGTTLRGVRLTPATASPVDLGWGLNRGGSRRGHDGCEGDHDACTEEVPRRAA